MRLVLFQRRGAWPPRGEFVRASAFVRHALRSLSVVRFLFGRRRRRHQLRFSDARTMSGDRQRHRWFLRAKSILQSSPAGPSPQQTLGIGSRVFEARIAHRAATSDSIISVRLLDFIVGEIPCVFLRFFWPYLCLQRAWYRRGRRPSHFLTILIHGVRFMAAVAAALRTAGFARGSNAWRR